jgi:ElaB/YqjD/DUF883 family membrane-anchored ribosome-binding protein
MTTNREEEQTLENAEAGTEQTRGRIGDDLRALGEKLTPENIKQEVKTEAKQAIAQAKDTAKEGVTRAGRATASFAKSNAVPLALIGAGLGWLFVSRRQRRAPEFEGAEYDERPELAERAEWRVRRASQRSREFAEDNPLAVGAMAVAAGVGVGLLLPATRKEAELMGSARDRLVDEARETAREIGQKARETAQELKQTVSEPTHH